MRTRVISIMDIGGVLSRPRTTVLLIEIALRLTSISYGPAVSASLPVADEVSVSRPMTKLLGLGTGAQAVPVNLRYCYAVSVYSEQVSLGASIG
jgi:hypothetical protein